MGVILDGSALPAWKARALREIQALPQATLVGAFRVPPLATRAGSRGFRLYERIDRRLFALPRDASAPIEVSDLLAEGMKSEPLSLVRGRDGGFVLDAASLAALRDLRLDALLQLGGPALDGDVLAAARLGLWTFAHDEALRRGRPPFWSEMAGGANVVESRLVARRASEEQVLYRSWASSNPNSLARQRHPVLWKSAAFPARALQGHAEGREPPFDGGPTQPEAAGRDVGAHTLALGRFAATAVARVVRNRLRIRKADRVWFVALRRRRPAPLDTDPLDGFEPLSCPEDRFHADPVLVHDGDSHHLFFEDADRASGVGKIAWRPLDADGRAGASQIVLETDCHLSYPFVFRWRDTFYMIPETSERRTIELYRAREFPLRWELAKVLFRDVAAVDTTLLEHAGRFWLFAAMSPTGASLNDELFLFHADTPLGEWVPHPWNPVVSDVRRARPAGPVFHDAGALWRPGQDCAGDYGAAFWLNRIDRLDPDGYHETPVRRIDAGWTAGGLCTHTYTRAGDFEAMDNRLWKSR